MTVTRDTLRRLRALRTQVGGDVDRTVAALGKAWRREWRDLDRRWAAASTAVVAAAAELGRWPQPWELSRIPETRQALDVTDVVLADLGRRTDKTVTETATAAVAVVVAAEALILASQYSAADRAAAVARFTARVPGRLVDLLSARVATRVNAVVQPLGGDTFDNVQRLLVRGIPSATQQRLTALIGAGFQGGLTRATAIARTEVLDTHREASHLFRVQNLEEVTGWVWVSTLSRTSCSACWAMHGTVYSGAAEAGPLCHPNGRCVALTLRFGDDLGALPDAQARFDALPEADQVAIAGPARHAMLRAGTVDWADLATRRTNSGWRPSYTPRPVADLQRIASRRI